MCLTTLRLVNKWSQYGLDAEDGSAKVFFHDGALEEMVVHSENTQFTNPSGNTILDLG